MIDHVYWKEGALYVLDQRQLPFKETFLRCTSLKDVTKAITEMAVRGAPLIGIVAAYGMVVGMAEAMRLRNRLTEKEAERVCRRLKETRPTAVNLFWALGKMRGAYDRLKGEDGLIEGMLTTAIDIHHEDIENNRLLSRYGSELLDDGDTVLTYCNAGALATGGYGTALGVVRAAVEAGKDIKVIACETRPFFQGARLTAWELKELGIDVTIVPDNHAGFLMEQGIVDRVIVGADRIARNGDVANKIGTYMVALAARDNGIPFLVAAPLSSFDEGIRTGKEISIEERGGEEVKVVRGRLIAEKRAGAKYYGFDITPGRLITYMITEYGIVEKPFRKHIGTLFSRSRREPRNAPH